jgi:hypothetical protein
MFIFDKLKKILIDEYQTIYNPSPFVNKDIKIKKDKKLKINVSGEYFISSVKH